MPHLELVTEIDAPPEVVWSFHDTLDALPRITPPGTTVRIPEPPARLAAGVQFTLHLRQWPIPFPLRWVVRYAEYEPPLRFVDEQVTGPFARWQHEHRFEPLPDGRTRLRDIVEYEPPFGILGRIADALFIRRRLTAQFAYRHRVTKQVLEAETAEARTGHLIPRPDIGA
jgi:ligand-binding SRPBCC domain-containing protein